MKWQQILILMVYGIPAILFLYYGIVHLNLYFSNKKFDHKVASVTAGRNLIFGVFLGLMTVFSYKVFSLSTVKESILYIAYVPLLLIALLALWTLFILFSTNEK